MYANIFSESLVNKLSLLDEVGIDTADIGRNCWSPQGWVVDGVEGGNYSGLQFQGSRKRSGTLAWLKERSHSWGLCICLTWNNWLSMCDICASLRSPLHLRRLACLEGSYCCGLPNLSGREERKRLSY